MSADSQRLKSALRRIVLESPELRELLGDSDNRGDQPGSAGVGTSEAEESRLCCDGSTSDNANPGTYERDPDADGAGQDGGLNSDDPARLENGGGSLSGVTDCATGEPVCFDGEGFLPPEGWDDPYDPPLKDGYEEGYFWIMGCLAGFSVNVYPSEGCWLTESEAHAAADAFCAQFDRDGTALKRGCNVSTPSDPSCCNPSEEDLIEDAWPEDGCTNLAIVGGQIVGSKYDPENDGSYSAPRDSIDLCSGGDQISLAPAANGGWKTINSTNDSGYLYDSSGKVIAHIDGNEYSDPDV